MCAFAKKVCTKRLKLQKSFCFTRAKNRNNKYNKCIRALSFSIPTSCCCFYNILARFLAFTAIVCTSHRWHSFVFHLWWPLFLLVLQFILFLFSCALSSFFFINSFFFVVLDFIKTVQFTNEWLHSNNANNNNYNCISLCYWLVTFIIACSFIYREFH